VENTRTDGKFLFPVKLCQSFRAKYCAKLKAKSPIQYEQIRQDLWKNRGLFFAKKPLEIQSQWWNIWDVTPIKSPLVTRELKVLTLKMYFDYKDYRIAGAKKKMTLTHQNLFGVLRCIFCPNVLSKYDIMVLSSTWKHQS
jgi:hypothetical protein